MELYQLQCFYEVAQEQNITRASMKLGVSQPALSKTINRLESDLGVSLFDRKAKAILLNEYGYALLNKTQVIFAAMDDIRLNIEDIQSGSIGKIRIGSTLPSIESSWLLDCIRDYIFINPKVSIEQRQMPPIQMQEAILENKIDIAIGGDYLIRPELEYTSLYDYKLGILVSSENRLAQTDTVSLSDLAEETFLINNSNTDIENTTYKICQMAGFEPIIALSSNYSRLIGELILANQGITIIPEVVYQSGIRREIDPEKIRLIHLREDYCTLKGIAAISRDRYVLNAARALYKEIVAYGAVKGEMI